MADLQARIGPKATKLYPNLTWKRPGADLQSPSKNTVKWSQTRQSDEKDDDSDASSHEHASSPIPSSPNKSRYRSSLSRPRDSSGQPSLLTRMGLSSDVSEDGASEGKEAVGIRQSLLPRVGTTEDTPRSSPNIGSTSVPNSNGYHDTAISKHASPQPPLPSSSNGQRNTFIPEKQAPDDRHNRISHMAPKTTTTLPILPLSREHDFEDGELVDSEPLPSQQVRDFLLPLVLKNAAHRVKEGDNDLTRLIAHSVLTDEVCSSFMDQMKEVRTEMHAHKNRSTNPLQVQLMGETNNSGAVHTLPSSKIGQARPRPIIGPIITGKYIPPNDEIVTKSSPSKDRPISALSSRTHDLPSSILERREPGFRHTPSPERRGFHDHDRGRRYSQHRERFYSHGSRSHSHSPSRYSRGQYYHRPSDSSRHMASSRSPLLTSPSRRRSPPGPTESTYFPDRALRESPEVIPGRRSVSPPGASNHNGMLESFSRGFKRIRNISPRWDTTDSPRSPVSRRHLGRRGADKVVSPRPSFTHDRGFGSSRSRRDSQVGIARSGSEFARRSASPRRKQDRQFSMERPLPRTPLLHSPRSATPNPYCQSPSSFELERPSAPRSLTPNPYYQISLEPERRRDWGADHMENVSPGAGSMSTHLTSHATGSHHLTPKPMVIDDKDIVNEVRTPKTSDDMPKSRLGVLPCHNVPGVWFIKAALGDIGILECSFEVDDVTALKWNLRPTNVNLPNGANVLQKEKLQLHVCCLSQKDVQSVMDSLKPDATAQDVATAMLTIENDWPTPGHLIIMVNPQDKNKRVWLPDKLESLCLPVCIKDCVVEGQNIVQFIQLSGMSERMFVLFATTRPPSDEQEHNDDEGFVLAPIDGGKKDIFDIGFGQVIISDFK